MVDITDARSAAAWDADVALHNDEGHDDWEERPEGCSVCVADAGRWEEYFDRKGWTREQLEEIQARIGGQRVVNPQNIIRVPEVK